MGLEDIRKKLLGVVGQLSEAERHLAPRYPEIAEKIRNLRKKIEKEILG